jgi:hypothetical protein
MARSAAWLVPVAALAALALRPGGDGARAQDGPRAFLSPAHSRVAPGALVDLEVRVENALDLAAFQFTIGFPPTVAFEGVDLGPFLGSTGRATRSFPPLVEPGQMTFVAVSSGAGPGPTGDGVLAVVHLRVSTTGGQTISLDNVLLTNIGNDERERAETTGAVIEVGPTATPTREPGQTAYLPVLMKAARLADLPVAPSVIPPSPTMTSPPPTKTLTPESPTATAIVTAEASPTPGKTQPFISELQCYGRHEWIKIQHPGGAAIDLEDWTIRSTVGGETFHFDGSLVFNAGETVTVHSGSGSPRGEDRLNKVWTQTTRWNEIDGDAGELSSPFPDSELVSSLACATPTPRAP